MSETPTLVRNLSLLLNLCRVQNVVHLHRANIYTMHRSIYPARITFKGVDLLNASKANYFPTERNESYYQ